MEGVRLEGVGELQAKIKELKGNLGNNKIEESLLDGATEIADEMRRLAPEGPTGKLKRSIISKLLSRIGDNPRTALAGVNRKKAPHAHLVEFGTVERVQKTTGRRTGHMPAHPFVRPAADANINRIYKEIVDKLEYLAYLVGK
jgi:HK97 gp10 family phage protein